MSWKVIATAQAGGEGQPGFRFSLAKFKISKSKKRFQLRISAESGSNQGDLQTDNEEEFEWRGDSIGDVTDYVAFEVVDAIKDYAKEAEIRQCLRELEYAVEDLDEC